VKSDVSCVWPPVRQNTATLTWSRCGSRHKVDDVARCTRPESLAADQVMTSWNRTRRRMRWRGWLVANCLMRKSVWRMTNSLTFYRGRSLAPAYSVSLFTGRVRRRHWHLLVGVTVHRPAVCVDVTLCRSRSCSASLFTGRLVIIVLVFTSLACHRPLWPSQSQKSVTCWNCCHSPYVVTHRRLTLSYCN